MAVKLQDFIGGRINPLTNPKHRIVSEFFTHNQHKNHGFDEKTAFLVEAVYEKIMSLRHAAGSPESSFTPTPFGSEGQATETVHQHLPPAPSMSPVAELSPPSDLASLIKKSDNLDTDSGKLLASGKSALSSMTNKW